MNRLRKIPVGFTSLELWALDRMSKERNDNKEGNGVPSKKIDKGLSDREAHYIGMKAEYAVARTLGVEFNPEHMLGGDAGHDLVYRGLSVDVKYSQLDLKFRPGTFLADVAILVQPLSKAPMKYGGKTVPVQRDKNVSKKKFSWKNVVIVGWISREEFNKNMEIRNFGYNNVEFIDAKKLSPMSEIKGYANGIARNKKQGTSE